MKNSEQKHLFTTTILLQVSDINYGGHLGNDRFLTLAQEARSRFFRSLGWNEKKLGNTSVGVVVTEAHLKFMQEGFLGDEIEVRLSIGKQEHCRFILFYDFYLKKSQKQMGKVWTQLAFFDYGIRKVKKCPEFYQAIEAM